MKKILTLLSLTFTFALFGQHNANTNFSITSNPNGVWTYGKGANETDFTLFTTSNSNASGVKSWNNVFHGFHKNTGTTPYQSIGVVWNPGKLIMHPNDTGETFAKLKFTAPTCGIYALQGLWKHVDLQAKKTNPRVIIHKNSGSNVLYSVTINGPAATTNYSGNVSLLVGEFITFEVGNGADSNIDDSTEVEFTVNLVSAITSNQDFFATICQGESYTFESNTYTQSGTFVVNQTDGSGCPLTKTLHLTVTPSTSNTTAITACDTYIWTLNGQTYTQSGNYSFINGCHTENLNLTITPIPTVPTLACYEVATFNTTSCVWDVTGTQPEAPSGLACYESATFNASSCVWEVTGTQPEAPSVACYETATFNTTSCIWDVTGIHPNPPTGLACYQFAIFDETSCVWDIIGVQPEAPTGLACYQSAVFNTNFCNWEVIGTQPTAPTGLACYQSATFNTTSCVWDVTGTQPAAPIGLPCYEMATFNTTSCSWVISSAQYNANANFSISSNPNGVWTYGKGANQTDFTLFTSSNYSTSGAVINWNNGVNLFPGFHKNIGTSPYSYLGVTWNPGKLIMHPDNTGETFTKLKFTANACGIYAIQGLWKNVDVQAHNTNPRVIFHKNLEITVLHEATLTGLNATTNYSGNVNLEVGDFITFEVGNAGDSNLDDSVETEITVNFVSPTVSNDDVFATICQGNSYNFENNIYTESGTYIVNITNTNCCTLTKTLHLTVTPTPTAPTVACYQTATFNAVTCQYDIIGTQPEPPTLLCNQTAIFNNITCVWDVTTYPNTVNINTIAACDTYTWANNGQTYTTSGIYTGTTTNCATEQLELTINNSSTNGNVTITVPGSYTWALPFGTGLTYTSSGIYTNTTTNAAGCSNVATLNLTISVNTINLGTTCGATISSLAVTIIAVPVQGALSYTFRLTNMATGVVQLINRPVNSFALSNYPGVTYGTAYQVQVSTNNGVTFGPPCNVNTPAPFSSIGAQCGTTLSSMTEWVYTTYVASATAYRFRVTNTTTGAVQVFDLPWNRFYCNQLIHRAYGTTYYVEVALKNTDGTYLPYNVGCSVTTPPFPTTTIQTSQCESTASNNTQYFSANVVTGALFYRFLVSRTTGPVYSHSIDRSLKSFSLSMFPGLMAGTTYNVQVAVRIDGVWGPYGNVCHITTPGGIARTIAIANASFKAMVYPNPSAENFMFDVTTTAESPIQIRVYDMLGKQIENKNVDISEIENLKVGANYPSGVYNVIISQDENTQTLRVIKR